MASLGEQSPKRELSEEHCREIVGTLAPLLDTIYCPILFCDYQQEIWREAFILPVIDRLNPVIERAVLARWRKDGRQAIGKALERVDRWIEEQFIVEFACPDDTINTRCQRWRRAIDALVRTAPKLSSSEEDYSRPDYSRQISSDPRMGPRSHTRSILGSESGPQKREDRRLPAPSLVPE